MSKPAAGRPEPIDRVAAAVVAHTVPTRPATASTGS
jgi:hypothetical protein